MRCVLSHGEEKHLEHIAPKFQNGHTHMQTSQNHISTYFESDRMPKRREMGDVVPGRDGYVA
jgi:hypothetical protein